MSDSSIIYIMGLAFLAIALIFYLIGKSILKMFPDLSTVDVVFCEKHASGYSNNSIFTKAGGASGVLEVIVTSEELWMKTGVFFSLFASLYNVLHRVSRKDLIRIEKLSQRKVRVDFKNELGERSSVTLKLQNADLFMDVFRKKI